MMISPLTVASPHPLPTGAKSTMMHLDQFENTEWDDEMQLRYPYLRNAVFRRKLAHHAGRVCAGNAISALFPDSRQELGVEIKRGRAGEPLWPTGVVGSITHTADFACAAVVSGLHCAAIGIDSERCVDDNACEAIATVCLNLAERKRFLRGDSCSRRWAATIVFSIKEAFYKAAYPLVERFIDFDEIEITRLDFASGRVAVRVAGSLSLHGLRDQINAKFALTDNHVHACVVFGGPAFVEAPCVSR